ncbi:cyclase/dehydrase [Pseudarthrobacter chlorophenolicus A6]|uniref:Cyclase/dehydrase n=1 Tax=Pseudarthrobacter chlorophenolicus (strain ATCC 700700 / DSM 12829 / CIP 107037 / JCM 12360 / KCTC 9906 / NCIMB 13794 / A6) TaxID=452863 RepID=B8HH78_PSECP|nr:SRPBCC family protein [Pseudarthrobacter chlorophenolicus]ACL41369.1 cyclase/dehydrase [Pseudarthrobacter chlorophenolicus A6]SDQ65355.1 Polyketide cyclase / dehydrase and lipid transport [Pseudarthrobacter chlorophenolicus]
MSTKVEKRILVNVPVSTAYNQWTQFEEFPHFMGGVKSVTQLSDDRLEWVAEIGGIRRQWEARILEQVPDRKVSWAATEGATNAGAVEFEDVGGGQTSLRLTLEYEPEGVVEKIGDKLHVVDRQAESDLQKFKEFIEDERYASGAWRGSVNPGASQGTPGVEHAGASRGDSGKAGVSGKVAAGVGVAAVAGAAAAMAASGTKETTVGADETVTPVTPGEPVTVTPIPTDTTADTTGSGAGVTGSGAGVTGSGAGVTSTTAAAGSTGSVTDGSVADGSVADLGDDRIGHPFDQTNGLVDTTGESDETREGEEFSAGERREDERRPDGGLPPVSGNLGQH